MTDIVSIDTDPDTHNTAIGSERSAEISEQQQPCSVSLSEQQQQQREPHAVKIVPFTSGAYVAHLKYTCGMYDPQGFMPEQAEFIELTTS